MYCTIECDLMYCSPRHTGSLWGSVPSLCLVEKGYSAEDYEVRQVNLLEGENFAPTYLRVNSKGTVPSLVVPIGVTTGQEVDTKFRALNGSIEIANFLGELTTKEGYVEC